MQNQVKLEIISAPNPSENEKVGTINFPWIKLYAIVLSHSP